MMGLLIIVIAIGVVIYSIRRTIKEFRGESKTVGNVMKFVGKLLLNIFLVVFYLVGLVLIFISV